MTLEFGHSSTVSSSNKYLEPEDEELSDIEIPDEYEDEMEYDSNTNAPIIRLKDGPIASGEGRIPISKNGISLKFALSPMDNRGAVYLSSIDGEKPENINTHIYPFQVPGSVNSEAYNRYSEDCFKNFEDILKNKKYKSMSSDLEVGVPSLLKEMKRTKAETLDRHLISLITDLQRLIVTTLDADEVDESEARGFETAITVLNLFRSLNFSRREERIGLLCNWVNRADLLPFEELENEFLSESDGFSNILFWSSLVQRLVMRGLFDEAVTVIGNSGYETLESSDPNLFLFISDFCTLLSSYDSVGFAIDQDAFLEWKQSMCQLRDKFGKIESDPKYQYFGVARQLEILLAIASGSPGVIRENTRAWYEALVAHYLFVLPDPTVIQEFFREYKTQIYSDPTSFTWEAACINLLEGNILSVISELEPQEKCTATYLSVLCEAGGLFEEYLELLGDGNNAYNKRFLENTDSMLKNLALSYFSTQKLIPVGIGILWKMNEPDARQIIAEILPRWYCANTDEFEYCLAICSELRLSATSAQLYKQQGQILKDEGWLLESLNMFSLSGDIGITARKSWELFESALVLGTKVNDRSLEQLIDNPSIEVHPVLRQCISPYAVLAQFYDLKNQGEIELAIGKLVSLIRFPYMQQHCTPLLLAQFVPFLGYSSKGNQSEVLRRVFSPEQLIIIIELLNGFDEKMHQKEPFLETVIEKSRELFEIAVSQRAIERALSNPSDWRTQARKLNITVPRDVKSLITLLRKSIAMEEGHLFLQ
ncbi:unnamed protein product [Kuraishia capsulata CBS 1993]|uniref:Nuclear pore complex protein Nup85 n=1 Tax=Kuraishia capsulata CBS 1993 TaxID=1382522 RepID=W6MNR5_9ASCO|nr:uncharacterized protein KUCA_T00002676001 [Kuraishia capsulata CBS 1993]CDK26702.1 unnamed protein product [Kuraishia capsulata CBS 1993]